MSPLTALRSLSRSAWMPDGYDVDSFRDPTVEEQSAVSSAMSESAANRLRRPLTIHAEADSSYRTVNGPSAVITVTRRPSTVAQSASPGKVAIVAGSSSELSDGVAARVRPEETTNNPRPSDSDMMASGFHGPRATMAGDPAGCRTCRPVDEREERRLWHTVVSAMRVVSSVEGVPDAGMLTVSVSFIAFFRQS